MNITADNDTRAISIKRVEAGSYVVMLDDVIIADATIRKVGKGWMLTTPTFREGTAMVFRTLKDASAHMISWFRLSYIPMLNADHAVAERVSTGIVVAPVELQIPAIRNEYGITAHSNTYAVDYNRIHEEMKGRQAMANMIMGNSDPIEDVVRFAQESIDALMPTLTATKSVFEALRDDESANPNHVDLAYQVYADTHRAIEEYKRTIAYARS